MEVDMDSSPGYFDPEDLSIREQFRRYGKRHTTSSMPPWQEHSSSRQSRLLYDGTSIHSPTNAALLLEDIKHESVGHDNDYLEGTPLKMQSYTGRYSTSTRGVLEAETDFDAVHMAGNYLLKDVKQEDEDTLGDSGETTFSLFASLFDSTLHGLMPIPDLIKQFELSCRDVSESIRYGSSMRHRIVEDKLMRQKAHVLLDEAATWSLLWYLYGKGNEEIQKDLFQYPTTSHLEACQFVTNDLTAQLCLRVVQWLEGLASKDLDLQSKVRGSYLGPYPPSFGIWHHTQRYLKKGVTHDSNTINHLDFDAPTREHAHLLYDDKKQEESLLEDLWILLRAGRPEEASDLCRSAGQPWRAATLSPFGGLDLFPSVGALQKNGKDRSLQAIELESGIGRQLRLWKWASYCASERIAEQGDSKYEAAIYAVQCSNLKHILPICTDWESACWAMAKSWLDVQVDIEISRLQSGGVNQSKHFGDDIDGSVGIESSSQSSVGSESWPLQVLNQQPRNLSTLLQKLHSGEIVHEAVMRGCKEQHRQIEMKLMEGNIPALLDQIWSWIAPTEDDDSIFRPHGDPQMMRFGAHLVLVLRRLLADKVEDLFKEKIMTVGDLILHIYTMFLFSKQHEELVGIYASQLAPHRCIDLFVHMMELRLNSSVHVKHRIFLSAIQYLPFSSEYDNPEDEPKGTFEEIIERVLSRSRETKIGKYDDSSDIVEQHRLQSLQKAMAIQWLCFTPPSTVAEVEAICSKLLLRALMHSNILFREFALVSMWRVPVMPIGAHKLLSFLAEPLKQVVENLDIVEDNEVSENLSEFQDWNEYYSWDATYRNWLKIELENAEVSSQELSPEEKGRARILAKESLDSSMRLLQRSENPWLPSAEDHVSEAIELLFLELHASAILCLPSGECLSPDATVSAALMSALYSSVSEEIVLSRQLVVKVHISPKDKYCIEVTLRCLAIEGDGLGVNRLNDGGVLATVMAAAFKGELPRFETGVTMEISRIDAWYSSKDGSLEGPASYIVRGLCRRCCIPELILRHMQVSVSLVECGMPPENHDEFIELVASNEVGFLHLFSQHQLQEFLLFEREYTICSMELHEETAPGICSA
ncbi:hypothetical protein SAY87_028507 [Trapa incisa]|uniref:Nuclear pore complex protein n=1 Tax=Trapa incisa TaxID=236973 RepID=A0AAN7KPD8_9MYRT|nr:hypothetical protein SAY87_028507 [Trapa incisa]